jgi:hypothetical protein
MTQREAVGCKEVDRSYEKSDSESDNEVDGILDGHDTYTVRRES